MTKKVVVCVRDLKADTFFAPVCEISEGTAVRSFQEAVNAGGENMIAKYPADFELVRLGTFDDETAVFDCGLPKQLALGSNLVVPKS